MIFGQYFVLFGPLTALLVDDLSFLLIFILHSNELVFDKSLAKLGSFFFFLVGGEFKQNCLSIHLSLKHHPFEITDRRVQ